MFFRSAIGKSLLVSVASLLLVSCASNRPALDECDGDSCVRIRSFPLVEQKNDFCGPAALAMVMNFYGAPVNQEEIAEEIYSPEMQGTLSIELFLYPLKHDFEAEMYGGNFDDLKQKLRRAFPLIVSIKEREETGKTHYMAVWGYDDKTQKIFAYTGPKSEFAIRYEDFITMWKRADFLTFWIYPKNGGIKIESN